MDVVRDSTGRDRSGAVSEQERYSRGERIMGIMEALGYKKEPKVPKPKLPVFREEDMNDTMVVNVTKKEDELKKELDELKKQMSKMTAPVVPEVEQEKPVEQPKEPVLSDIELQVKEFYDEYGIFNATASNESLMINLLYGILQELKKLNRK